MSSILLLGCTVCYGDPTSPLTKGAAAGVLVMGIAIGGVLATFTGLFFFWMKRARAIDALAAARPPATAVPPSAEPPRSAPPSEPPSLTLH